MASISSSVADEPTSNPPSSMVSTLDSPRHLTYTASIHSNGTTSTQPSGPPPNQTIYFGPQKLQQPLQPQSQPQPQIQQMRSVKRPRPVKSCMECRKRKLRCDRVDPCAQCTRSHRTCRYTADQDSANLSDGSDAESVPTVTPKPFPPLADNSHRPPKRTCLPIGSTMSLPGGASPSMTAPSLTTSVTTGMDAGSLTGKSMDHSSLSVLEDINMRLERLEKQFIAKSPSTITDNSSSRSHMVAAAPDTLRILSVKGGAQRTRFHGQSSARVMMNLFREAQEYLGEHANIDGLRQILLDLHKLHKVLQEDHRKALTPITVFIDSMIPVQKRMTDILPNKLVCDRLFRSYIDTSETMLRMLHIPTFQQQYALFWEGKLEGSDSFLPQLLCVLSIGARFESKSRGMSHDQIDNIHIPTACALVRSWLDHLRGKQLVDFITLQSEMLLLYATRMTTPRPHDSWTQLGCVMRMAMTMGLHRDPSEFGSEISPFWAELRRRLWYTMLDMDTMMSMACSLPSLIREDDFTCKPPSNLNDSDLFVDMIDLPPSRPIDQVTDNQIQAYATTTLPLRMKVAHLVNRLDTIQDWQEITDLGERLTKCLEDINYLFPRHGIVDDQGKSRQWRSRVIVDFHIRRPLLALYRPFAMGVPEAPSQIVRSYLQSSMVILRYLEEIDPRAPYYQDVSDMYHHVMRPDIMQAAFSVCYFIKLARQSPVMLRQSGIRLSPDFPDINHSYDAVSIWSPSRLVETVQKTLGLLIRYMGGIWVKDTVLLSVVLYSVQAADDPAIIVPGLHSMFEACLRATNTGIENLANVPLQKNAMPTTRQPFNFKSHIINGAANDGTGAVAEIDEWAAWGGWMTES